MRKFNKLHVPDQWNNYFTRYPQGYTILESLLNWVTQVDNMVDNQNELNTKVSNFRTELDDFVDRFDPRLQEEVISTLSEWQDSGFLDVVIDEALQTQMDVLEQETQDSLNSVNQQLAQKANEQSTSNSLNVLKNQKVDQVTFDLATQEIKFYANENLIDSVDITEASNASLVQDYIDILVADGLIEGVSLADGSVVTEKYSDQSITNEKFDRDFAVKAPWLNQPEDDVDYMWEETNRMIGIDTKNNPFNNTALVNAKRFKTQYTSNGVWIVQEVFESTIASNAERVYRFIQVNESTLEILQKRSWRKILTDSVTIDDLVGSLSQKTNNILVAEGAYDPEAPHELDGFYGSSGWVERIEFDSYKLEVDYLDQYNIYNTTLTIIGFDENGEMTQNLSSREQFTISNKNTKYITIPIRKGNRGITNFTKGDYLPDRILNFGETQTRLINFEHQDNKYVGTTWVAIGTSMTSRGEYTNHVANKLNLDLDNRGVGSGGITTNAGAGNTTMQAVESIEDFKGIVSIEIGPNDWLQTPLGEIGDTEDDTWYGAVDKVCRTISERTSARPFIITGTTTAFSIGADFDESKRRSVYYKSAANGVKYIEYVNAAKEVAQHYGIPVCDVFGESGLGSYHQNSQTLSDHIHLTNLGGEIYGNHIIDFLKYKFSSFPLDYENPLAID